jgi:FkbM family methyltransferase
MAAEEGPQRMLWFTGDPRVVKGEPERELGWATENLRKPGFSPATIIDVGVGWGTPPIYRSFPEAHHVLIEPLKEYEDNLKRWVAQFGGEYLLTAVGEREGSVTLHVDPEFPLESSLLAYAGGRRDREVVERTVSMTTLDKLLEEHHWKPPFGLKIDTEGYEHRVIEGATGLLAETQFVIAEVCVARRFQDGYSFAEFIALMDSLGFGLYDVVDGLKAFRGKVFFIDALFRREP